MRPTAVSGGRGCPAGRELTQDMSVFQALAFRSLICVAILERSAFTLRHVLRA
jgi:hypothetical protein